MNFTTQEMFDMAIDLLYEHIISAILKNDSESENYLKSSLIFDFGFILSDSSYDFYQIKNNRIIYHEYDNFSGIIIDVYDYTDKLSVEARDKFQDVINMLKGSHLEKYVLL